MFSTDGTLLRPQLPTAGLPERETDSQRQRERQRERENFNATSTADCMEERKGGRGVWSDKERERDEERTKLLTL